MASPTYESPRIVCIPYAGVGASAFARWRTLWGDALVITLPGREARHAMASLRSIDAMAAWTADVVNQSGLMSTTLFGHSLGALVAYEATRLLANVEPEAVTRLVVSACLAPTSTPPIKLSGIEDNDAFMQAVGALGGFPAEIADEPVLMRYALPILRADLQAIDTYHHVGGKRLNIPLLALGGDDDPFVPSERLAEWAQFTDGPFDSEVFAGDHFFIHRHADRVARLVKS